MHDGTTITTDPEWDPYDEYRDDSHYRDGYADAMNRGEGLDGEELDDLFWREVDERRTLMDEGWVNEQDNAYRLGIISGFAALWNAWKYGKGSNSDQ